MKDILEKWASTVLAFITTGVIVALFSMWSRLGVLELWKSEVYPLEKQAILLERAQIAAKVEVNERKIKDLEDELRRIRP